MGFISLLQLTFIILKLCNIINWNWLWVMSPLWISTLLGIALLLVITLRKED